MEKIDILINVGIFNSTLLGISYPPRGLLHRDSQLDIFKYTLASLSALNELVNQIHIYIELEPCFHSQQQELEDYANKLFGTKLNYHNYRNLSQQQWQDACNKIETDTIWFLCNHDHFFIQPSLDILQYCLQTLQQDTHKYKAIHFSHTPDLLPAIKEDRQNNRLYYMDMSPDSIQIVNKNTLNYWWFNRIYNQTFRRTDERSYAVDIPRGACYIPPVEICCHYDGYWVPGLYPAYVIPPGFFENQVKIRYGYADRKEDCVNINPSIINYNDVDPDGIDYKWILNDIPLFWQDKILDIDINPATSHNQALHDRNIALLDRLKSRLHKTQYFPARNNNDILDPIIEQYIKRFDPTFNT